MPQPQPGEGTRRAGSLPRAGRRQLVLHAGKAVAFVLIDLEDGRAAVLLDGGGDLLGFGAGAAGVVGSGEDEQRGLDSDQ